SGRRVPAGAGLRPGGCVPAARVRGAAGRRLAGMLHWSRAGTGPRGRFVVRSIGVAAFLALAACATAGERVPPEGLRISAREAEQTAYTRAVTWASDAVLRYVEGEVVAADGYVLPGQGAWRFIYGSAGREDELVVTVTPTTIEQEARPRQSPPGFALGDAALDDGWIDSPRALAMTGAGA